MLREDFSWDAIQMPVNILDANLRSFQKLVSPEAVKRKLAVIGTNFMAFKNDLQAASAPECLRSAMSLPVSVSLTGCETMERFKRAVAVAGNFKPM